MAEHDSQHQTDHQRTAGMTGILYVVPTPIGNLADMVPRAIEALQSANVIAAEDTRHSSRLMAHFSITAPMVAYHDHTGEQRVAQLIRRLQEGDTVALISDAGTPLISDPGYRLVQQAVAAGVKVVPIPGACALIAALSASGLPSDRFVFEGFLPAKSVARQGVLQTLVDEPRTVLFYEAPHRIVDTLQDMVTVLGAEREVVLARELTKTFETIRLLPVAELLQWVQSDSNQQRGEMVLLVRGVSRDRNDELSAEVLRIMAVLLDELPLKQAAALGAKLTGEKKNRLYQWALEQRA